MKAPDKIYRTTTYLDNDRGKVVYKEIPVKGAENIEYIRKDALLEWAKKKYAEYKQLGKYFQGDVFIGNRQSYTEIIAKIESL